MKHLVYIFRASTYRTSCGFREMSSEFCLMLRLPVTRGTNVLRATAHRNAVAGTMTLQNRRNRGPQRRAQRSKYFQRRIPR
jgi:hypothetical protein